MPMVGSLQYFFFGGGGGGLRRFQHCTGHITTGSWKGRGNQYIQFVRVVYCKLPTNGKQLPAFPLEAVLGIEPRPQRWEARVLPLCHRGPWQLTVQNLDTNCMYWFPPPTELPDLYDLYSVESGVKTQINQSR